MKTTLSQIDQKVLLSIQRYRPKFLNRVFVLLTSTGTSRAWVSASAVVVALNFMKIRFVENQVDFLRSLLAPLLAWGLSVAFKRAFARKRPSFEAQGLSPLIQTPTCGSFPSGHAATSFAFFFALLLIDHPVALWIGVWAALVSFSRMYLGVHYLSDIAGGIILGFVSALLLTAWT